MMRRLFALLPTLLTILCGLALLAHGPIAQPPDYHAFADATAWLNIPNAMDVLSNIGFALVGLWGIVRLWPARHHPALARGRAGYALFLAGLTLTAFGSAYYHWAPDNMRLAWDRLPIALACAGLLAGVWAETALKPGKGFWAVLVVWGLGLFGATGVGWWYFTEMQGQGDLRPYLLLQLLPLVLIPLWQWIHKSAAADRLWFGAALLLYVFAKIAEIADHPVLELTQGLMSGHTLKHLLATAAAAALVHRLIQRIQLTCA